MKIFVRTLLGLIVLGSLTAIILVKEVAMIVIFLLSIVGILWAAYHIGKAILDRDEHDPSDYFDP